MTDQHCYKRGVGDFTPDRDQLVGRLLDQNERLIGLLERAISGSNPVALIQALNPPFAAEGRSEPPVEADPWQADQPPHEAVADPWGDESVTLERLRTGQIGHGFISSPEAPSGATAETPLPLLVGDDGAPAE